MKVTFLKAFELNRVTEVINQAFEPELVQKQIRITVHKIFVQLTLT